ncbi:MAG TPA: hypothetical protein PLV68_16800, partial [Ilumatobacteraceae bacterium]|nr:hypothetical protein [Ilumatobacteraceae bacterium]
VDHDPAPPNARLLDDHALATVAFRRLGGRGRLWEASPIPMARGLGYSAAVRVGGLLVACAQRHPDGSDGDVIITVDGDEV